MDSKSIPQPPHYWFCLLLDAIRNGNFDTARHADARLREVGIEVSFRTLLPDPALVTTLRAGETPRA